MQLQGFSIFIGESSPVNCSKRNGGSEKKEKNCSDWSLPTKRQELEAPPTSNTGYLQNEAI